MSEALQSDEPYVDPLDSQLVVLSEVLAVENHSMSGEEEYYTLLEKQGRLNQPTWKQGWPLCVICQGEHLLVHCPKWWDDSLNYEQRKKVASEHKRCYRCLSPIHSVAKCPRRDRCSYCLSDSHHTRLHDFFKEPKADGFVTASNSVFTFVGDNGAYKMRKKPELCTISFSVCYIKNPANGEKTKVCLIRDNCCSESICCMSIARKLGFAGETRERTTNGVGGCKWTTDVMSSMASLESLDGRHSFTIPLSFADKPCGDLKYLDWTQYIDNHPALLPIKKFLPQLSPEDNQACLMILGTDNPTLILKPDSSLDEVEGVPSWIGGEGYCKPFALRTVLGWSVCGFTGAQPPNPVEIVNGKTIISHCNVAFVGQEQRKRADVVTASAPGTQEFRSTQKPEVECQEQRRRASLVTASVPGIWESPPIQTLAPEQRKRALVVTANAPGVQGFPSTRKSVTNCQEQGCQAPVVTSCAPGTQEALLNT